MALLVYNIDTRIIGNIVSRSTGANVATFAHGLPGIPHICDAQFAVASAGNANWVGGLVCLYDANNVSIINCGDIGTGDLLVTTMLFHSIIQ